MVESILIIDDDPDFRLGLKSLLSQEYPDSKILQSDSVASALNMLKTQDIQLMLLDYKLNDENGLSILRAIPDLAETIDVIMITAHGSIDLAIEAMTLGASDFVVKPIVDFEQELFPRIKKVLENRKYKQVSEFYEINSNSPDFIGTSPKIVECKELARSVADSDTTVLIQGDTGTGKEVLALYIHSISNRRDRPFVVINCANQTEELIAPEIFGHERGAFTGANTAKKGLVELADGGTILFDEIGELSLAIQAKILRFLEDGKYTRVGGTKERKIHARILAATNRDLKKMVEIGIFRSDLFFRLNVFPIYMPSLKKRKEDIPDLVYSFLRKMTLNVRKKDIKISEDAMEYLLEYDWPGNIRELRNVVERATVLAQDALITRKHLPALNPINMPEVIVKGNPLKDVMRKTQKDMVLNALEASGWNQAEAARKLGMTRQNLIKLMKKHEILIVKGREERG